MDIYTKKKRGEIMSKVKGRDTKIEVDFRKTFWRQGYRYLKNSKKYLGKPDLVLPRHKTVIFLDSCFWHGCKKHGSIPETRKEFWENKIGGNKMRDKEVNKYYKTLKWNIVRIWEHDLRRKNFDFDKIIKQ